MLNLKNKNRTKELKINKNSMMKNYNSAKMKIRPTQREEKLETTKEVL